jgi:hypothetical protein
VIRRRETLRLSRWLGRWRTVCELVRHFARRQPFFFVPFVLILLASSLVLVLTSGVGYVAPFFYTLF